MTHFIQDLVANGVDPRAVEFRKWRETRRLTLNEAARLLGVSLSLLHRVEIGKLPMSRLMSMLTSDLVMRWTDDMRLTKKYDRRGRAVWA